LFKRDKNIKSFVKKPTNGGTPAIENRVEVNIKPTEGWALRDDNINNDKLFEYPSVWRVHITNIEAML